MFGAAKVELALWFNKDKLNDMICKFLLQGLKVAKLKVASLPSALADGEKEQKHYGFSQS
jgi:hypothetical protein